MDLRLKAAASSVHDSVRGIESNRNLKKSECLRPHVNQERIRELAESFKFKENGRASTIPDAAPITSR
jgi:hypothetical protein